MYYTGINPLDMKNVYSPDDYREKLMQRALLQYKRPENRNLVREALEKAGREELIGFGAECLVKPDMREGAQAKSSKQNVKKPLEKSKNQRQNSKSKQKNQKNSARNNRHLSPQKPKTRAKRK
jgi:hypothetical protein